MIDETNEAKNNLQRTEFMEKYGIHQDYYDFFTVERVADINSFIKCMEIRKIEYIPKREYIFKALRSSILSRKICILSNEPYSQGETATGLALEVQNPSWNNHEINVSLKNILKLLYKTYEGTMEDIDKIRKEISYNKFNVLPPDKLFKSWEKQGVLLLNSSLTTKSLLWIGVSIYDLSLPRWIMTSSPASTLFKTKGCFSLNSRVVKFNTAIIWHILMILQRYGKLSTLPNGTPQ